MAGSPKKRARRELAEAVASAAAMEAESEPDSYPEAPNKRGASPEWMAEITRRRMEMAKTDPAKKGGRPRTNFTRGEATEAALRRLEPAAVQVLERQLRSRDERVAQRAAQLLLEWRRGKPSQSIKQTTDNVTRIVYESAAWFPDGIPDSDAS